ncbi:hypothetical protein JOF28_000802 [Leucobacter exalbidus]|uniref:Winged helix DNA-binding domain-containing protein n=1 Tax=Leucobacter exalbidus TaxID=662960 RepID=A0A940PLZ6_9MICO|nr:winged helix DNA-binding domain-containing protein [Leucobacter exalbidus]MBP1325570.1 hypothetical protein [Leucobacter exalbidus]
MVATLTGGEVLQLRMRAQLLSRVDPDPHQLTPAAPGRIQGRGTGPGDNPGAEGIARVARHMLAVQGQDWLASRWALGVRAPGTHVGDVTAALDGGAIVRSWPMRGTVHLCAAEDIGWLQRTTEAKLLRGVPKRRELLGLSEALHERLTEVSLAALAGGARLTRDELSQAWTEAGVEWRPAWRYLLVWWICQNGLATQGPLTRVDGTLAKEPLLVHADDWFASAQVQPRALLGDEALEELAARYTRARGPVTTKDFAWWTGLTMRESARAFALAVESETVTAVHTDEAGAHWIAPELLGTPVAGGGGGTGGGAHDGSGTPSWQLLTAFDEHLLGYTERRPQLQSTQFSEIVPGRNGVFRATVVADGITRGTWRRAKTHGSHIVATPLAGEQLAPRGLDAAVAAWARFHDFEAGSLEVAEPAF